MTAWCGFGGVVVTGIGRGKLPARVGGWRALGWLTAARCWPSRKLPAGAPLTQGDHLPHTNGQNDQVDETAQEDQSALPIAIASLGGEDRVHPPSCVQH